MAATLKFMVGKEIEENPECELCRKFGHEPNETTKKAMKEKGGKSFKTVKALMKNSSPRTVERSPVKGKL